jgi:hypothetical protein
VVREFVFDNFRLGSDLTSIISQTLPWLLGAFPNAQHSPEQNKKKDGSGLG